MNTFEASGLKCPQCDSAGWKNGNDCVACLSCASTYRFDDGVLRMDGELIDSTTEFYAAFGGAHFLNTSFAASPVIHSTTRRYRLFVEEEFPSAKGSVLDFGCGDGRLSLWAAEKGFSQVVATDSNLDGLKRLARESRHRHLSNILVICCDMAKPPFARNHFDAILCFEVLCYLVRSIGRLGALNLPVTLLKHNGILILSEMNRYGRALVDLEAMDVPNIRSLVESGTRWEKSDQGRLEVFFSGASRS